MPQILRLLDRRTVRLWTAHYTYRPHLCSPACGFGFNATADATQFTDRALNRNLDESVCDDWFFGAAPVEHHYDRFWPGRERQLVESYDQLDHKKHPIRARELRRQLLRLRNDVAAAAHAHAKPDWQDNNRGWRWQELNQRLNR